MIRWTTLRRLKLSVASVLWRSSNATMARWLPYDESRHPEPDDTDSRTKSGTFATDTLPRSTLQRAPPSLGLALSERNASEPAAQAHPQLEFLRGKRVALVGCSLDRFALISLCKTMGAGAFELKLQKHAFSSCYLRVSRRFACPGPAQDDLAYTTG